MDSISWDLYSPAETAKSLLGVIANAKQTGQFLAFNGTNIKF